jgi:hypothetical protein
MIIQYHGLAWSKGVDIEAEDERNREHFALFDVSARLTRHILAQ